MTSPLERHFWKGKFLPRHGSGAGSGPGSTLTYTQRLRARLPRLLAEYRVRTFLDAPCGEMDWILDCPLRVKRYIGMDIAPDIIAENQRTVRRRAWRFVHGDITRDALPAADMMMCRDCLFHLPHHEIWRFFQNFAASDIPYLLTTSHVQPVNRSVETPGEFRFLNLLIAPFNLPAPLEALPDYLTGKPRFLFLWDRAQIVALAGRAPDHLTPEAKKD